MKKTSTWILVVAIVLSGGIIALTLLTQENPQQQRNTSITTSSQEADGSFEDWLETQNSKTHMQARDTEDISQILLTEYLQSENISNLSDIERQQIIQNAIGSFSIERTHFSENDFTVIPTSPESLQTYGNKLAQALQTPEVPDQNEIEIVFDALAENDPLRLTKLKIIKTGYDTLLEDIQNIDVPQEMLEAHTLLADTAQTIVYALDAFERIFDDPAPGLLYLEAYSDITNDLTQSLADITQVFVVNQTTFTQNDDGYIFTSGL